MANDGTLRLGIDIDEGSFKQGLSALGKTAGIALGAATAATTAFAKSAVDAGMNFDTSMSQVAATMGKTVDEIQDLRSFAMEMGATTAFSASEAADGLNILAMAGLNATEQMEALPRVMDLAAAGALSLDASASYVTASVKGFGDEMSNAQYYADLMAKGATLANTNVAGLGEALSRSAATASTYGQEADSLTLSLLRLAEQNVTGEAASTALNRAMSDLYTPTVSAKKALDQLGISTYDYSSGKARDFNVVVDELKTALSGMTQEEANAAAATIFTTEGLNAFNKMTATSASTMQKFKSGLADVFGSAAQQAGTQLDNLAGDITLFQSALEGAQIVLSDQLTPTLRDFVQFGTDAVQRLSDAFQEGGLEGLTEELGNVLSDAIAMIMDMLPTMIDAGMGLLEALGKGILDNLPQITSAALDIVLTLSQAIISALPAVVEAGIQMIAQLANGIAQGIPSLLAKAADAVISIANALTDPANLGSILAAGLEIILALAQGLSEQIPKIIEALPQIFENIATFYEEHMPELLDIGVQIIKAIIEGILNAIPALLEVLPELISTFVDMISAYLPELLEAGVEILMALLDGLIQAIPLIVGALPQIIEAIIESIPPLLAGLFDAGASILHALIEGIVGAIPDLVGAIPQIISAIVDTLLSLIGSVVDVGRQLVGGLIDGITGVSQSSSNSGRSTASSARPRMAARAMSNDSAGNGEEGVSLTASTFSRASAVRALESAMPNIEARVSMATAAMAPAAGYAAPGSFSGGGSGAGNQEQAPIIVRPNMTVQFQGDLAQLGRVLNPVIKGEDNRLGAGV